MKTVNEKKFLLLGSESYQESSFTGQNQAFANLNEILDFLRNMKLQKEYFEILDVKSGRNVTWAELN